MESHFSEPTPIRPDSHLEENPPHAKIVAGLLEHAGLFAEEVSIEGNSAYTKVFIIRHDDQEKSDDRVRIYRGVNNLDSSLVNQEPYINRFEKYKTLEDSMQTEIDHSLIELSKNPTKETLESHIARITPYLSEKELREAQEELQFIEEGCKQNGFSVRKMLHQKQIAHPMGSSTFGLSPYLSASYAKREVYAGTAILVLDVPIAQIEDWDPENDSETNYCGKLNPDHISAILVEAEYNPMVYKKPAREESAATLEKVDAMLPALSPENTKALREKRHAEILAFDEKHREH